MKLCPCGSGEPRRELLDRRGIFCGYVCDQCEQDKRSQYHPDIFTDANYWPDEAGISGTPVSPAPQRGGGQGQNAPP
jgi:hypothetical protein